MRESEVRMLVRLIDKNPYLALGILFEKLLRLNKELNGGKKRSPKRTK